MELNSPRIKWYGQKYERIKRQKEETRTAVWIRNCSLWRHTCSVG